MLLNSADRDTLTFSFMIPNVSHLLIFRDHWNNSMVMRKVITELLQLGYYNKLYLGNDPDNYFASNQILTEDCVIINIKIQGITLLEYKIDYYTDYFIAELHNRKNVFHFDSVILDASKKINLINISVKITESVKTKSEIQAA